MRTVDQCGLCGSTRLRTVLSLGVSPPTCVMPKIGATTAVAERHHPLELLRCEDCTLVQLGVIVDPGEVFPPDYPYSSGNSRALHMNFADLAREAIRAADLGPMDLVVDIGANDGTLLGKFSGTCRAVGVEPTRQARRITGPVYQQFFSEALAHEIRAQHGPAKVVTACNVLAHVEDIGDVMRGIKVLLADDGILVAENHDLKSLVDGGQWDTVYHEHLRFYDPYSFHSLLWQHDLGMWEWKEVPTHGGSFRMVAARGGGGPVAKRDYDFDGLARDAAQAREAIRALLRFDDMVGIGATARATTIINYCGLTAEDLDYVCEVRASDKIGHYIPGTRIPVVSEEILFGPEQPTRALLFSWHMADVIVPKLRQRGYEGEIIVPLPTVRSL